MIHLVPMSQAHVSAIELQAEQAYLTPEDRMNVAAAQAGYGPCWAALADDGMVVAIGGMCDSWAGRAICWSGLSKHAGPHMLALTRAMRRMMDELPYHRLEMYVDAGSATAQRWAEMLGFHNETPTPMRSFLPDRRAAYLYGRVRE